MGAGDSRLSRLVVSEDHVRSINACLDHVLEEGNAQFALLVDRSGQLVSHRGEAEGHAVEGLGALLAGNFASAREIAKLIGEESFGAVLQQGQRQHIFTSLINEHWMLSVIFEARTPVGLVKLLCGRAAIDLQSVHRAVCEASDGMETSWTFDHHFRTLAQNTIDLLLRDGS